MVFPQNFQEIKPARAPSTSARITDSASSASVCSARFLKFISVSFRKYIFRSYSCFKGTNFRQTFQTRRLSARVFLGSSQSHRFAQSQIFYYLYRRIFNLGRRYAQTLDSCYISARTRCGHRRHSANRRTLFESEVAVQTHHVEWSSGYGRTIIRQNRRCRERFALYAHHYRPRFRHESSESYSG